MKILALALADDSRRFIRGFPPRGARLLLNPDLEIAGLCSVAGRDQIIYQDEKAEALDLRVPFDWALVSTDFWQEPRIREVVLDVHERCKPAVLFGPVATCKHEELAALADAVVIGNILGVWNEIRTDAAHGRLRRVYRSPQEPVYAVPDLEQTMKPAFHSGFQCLRAVIGCGCPVAVRPYCRQFQYHGARTLRRDLDELTSEVYNLRYKHVYLLDENVARDRAFYAEFFSRVWRHKREWSVTAGRAVFDEPSFTLLLAKAGVRVVNLDESWLSAERIERACRNPQLARQMRNEVRLLHRQRLLVGARISQFVDPSREYDYEMSYRFIDSLSIDFLMVRMFMRTEDPAAPPATDAGTQPLFVSYRPGLLPDRPTWWKNQFYGIGAIVRRSLRRPVRVGFYSTFRHYFPRSFAYRQNFLEGIAYPP
jgi:hypothetical protein